MLAIREKPADEFRCGNIGIRRLTNQENAAQFIRHKVKFLGADIYITGQNIIGDDILDKCGAVVLFLVIGERLVKSNRRDGADRFGNAVRPVHKSGITQRTAFGIQHHINMAGGDQLIGIRIKLGQTEVLQTRAD